MASGLDKWMERVRVPYIRTIYAYWQNPFKQDWAQVTLANEFRNFRDEVLEEAAQVAEQDVQSRESLAQQGPKESDTLFSLGGAWASKAVATAIRSRKHADTPTDAHGLNPTPSNDANSESRPGNI